MRVEEGRGLGLWKLGCLLTLLPLHQVLHALPDRRVRYHWGHVHRLEA